jgi:hypothetical protein
VAGLTREQDTGKIAKNAKKFLAKSILFVLELVLVKAGLEDSL